MTCPVSTELYYINQEGEAQLEHLLCVYLFLYNDDGTVYEARSRATPCSKSRREEQSRRRFRTCGKASSWTDSKDNSSHPNG